MFIKHCISLCLLLVINTSYGSVTFEAKQRVIILPIDTLTSQAYNSILQQAPLYEEPIRGKTNTAILLFSGLAQTCFHAGQVAGATTAEEKKQGLLNGLGSVFSTVAAIANDQKQDHENKANLSAQTARSLAQLAVMLEPKDMPKQFDDTPDYAMLQAFRACLSQEEKECIYMAILSDKTHAEAFIFNTMTRAANFLNDNINLVFEAIEQNVTDIVKATIQQELSRDATAHSIDPTRFTGNVIFYAVSSDPQKNSAFIKDVSSKITKRLWQLYQEITMSQDDEPTKTA